MNELPPTEGQMTPLADELSFSELRKLRDRARTTWAYSVDGGVRDLWYCYIRREQDGRRIAALQQQLAEANARIEETRRYANYDLWTKDKQMDKYREEIDARRQQLASRDAELAEKQKYVLQLERAVTALQRELADELKAQIEQRKATGLRTLSEEARYEQLTGRNYGSEGE